MADSTTCTCGHLKVRIAGTYQDDDGAESCNNCKRPLQVREPEVVEVTGSEVPLERVTTLAEVPGHRISDVHGVVMDLSAIAGLTARVQGSTALDVAMTNLRRDAEQMSANAIVGLHASTFAAGGGVAASLGGDGVGVLLMGTAVTVVPA